MKRTGAFTLAELLIALAITSVLVILLANVVSATMTAWQQGRNRLDTFSNARQLIGRLADELGAATTGSGRADFIENATELEAGGTAAVRKSSENIFFVAPYPNSGSGDLCVVAYRHNKDTHQLERAFKNSADAWSPVAASRYRINGYTGSGGFEWRKIADGVMEFEIRSYSQQDLDNNVDPPNDTWNSASNTPDMQGKAPRRVVLRLKVVDDRTLARLGALSQANIDRAARDFTADFSLPSR